MDIQIKYFGAIAEITQSKVETLSFEGEQISIESIKNELVNKYQLNLNSFSIALNKTIAKANEMVFSKDEIAILPPFAGG